MPVPLVAQVPSPRIWALARFSSRLVSSHLSLSSVDDGLGWCRGGQGSAPRTVLDRQRGSATARVPGWSGPCSAMSAAAGWLASVRWIPARPRKSFCLGLAGLDSDSVSSCLDRRGDAVLPNWITIRCHHSKAFWGSPRLPRVASVDSPGKPVVDEGPLTC